MFPPLRLFRSDRWNEYGGLIALMLGRLRMSVKDAVKAYGELSKEVFSDVKSQGSMEGSRHQNWRKQSRELWAHSASQDPEEGWKYSRENPCKRLSKDSIVVPMLKEIFNLVLFELDLLALRRHLDGGMGQNNPIAALLLEAQRLFPLDVIEAIKGIATDCEKQHQLSAHHFDPVPHVYFRFNVERGMQDIQLNQWERLGDVAANTRQYLLSHPTQTNLWMQ
ncbi:hypothetical protein B0H13DRAFT_2298615 [Mycena leptocephala]|nr:hypothetical protein B0H13DRAFT_2298615 [Mycena leptocephala]